MAGAVRVAFFFPGVGESSAGVVILVRDVLFEGTFDFAVFVDAFFDDFELLDETAPDPPHDSHETTFF